VLSSTAAELGYVSSPAVRWMFDEHVQGRSDRTSQLWALLMLELWFREVVKIPIPDAEGVPALAT